jgi:hypothetical protein
MEFCRNSPDTHVCDAAFLAFILYFSSKIRILINLNFIMRAMVALRKNDTLCQMKELIFFNDGLLGGHTRLVPAMRFCVAYRTKV